MFSVTPGVFKSRSFQDSYSQFNVKCTSAACTAPPRSL